MTSKNNKLFEVVIYYTNYLNITYTYKIRDNILGDLTCKSIHRNVNSMQNIK